MEGGTEGRREDATLRTYLARDLLLVDPVGAHASGRDGPLKGEGGDGLVAGHVLVLQRRGGREGGEEGREGRVSDGPLEGEGGDRLVDGYVLVLERSRLESSEWVLGGGGREGGRKGGRGNVPRPSGKAIRRTPGGWHCLANRLPER